MKKKIGDEFWSHVDKKGGPDRLRWETDDPWLGDGSLCWIWLRARSKRGYGILELDRRRLLAHRYAWELDNNESIQPDLCVMHWCDHPVCVNPDHLYLGTKRDVMSKRDARGHHGYRTHPERWSSGARTGKTNLTDEDIREIRRLHCTGMRQSELVKKFNASRNCISKICNRISWKHVR